MERRIADRQAAEPAAGPGLRLSVPADPARLGQVAERVRDHIGARGVPEERVFAADVVLEELVSNVAKYAYGGRGGDVELEVETRGRSVVLRIRDRGPAFDPTAHPEVPPPANGGPVGEGGRGIHLVRKLARTFRWRRDGERNVVEVELADEGPG